MAIRYREVFLEKAKVLADSGTEIIDLDVVDPISELHILMWATNGATSNKNNPIARNVSKIEVVDGSEVLFSMDGRLAQALAYWWTKRYPYKAWQSYGGATQEDAFPIYFGRHLWDPQFGVHPPNFRNLQLKVTWDLASVNAVGATGFSTGTGRMTVIARVMEGLDTPPAQYFIHKNQYSFTSAASGDERIDLPNDYPWVGLMVRAWESGVGINSSITNAKLSLDQDKYVPFDMGLAYQEEILEEVYGLISHGIRAYEKDNGTVQVWLAMQERANVNVETNRYYAGLKDLVNGQMTVVISDSGGAAVATDQMLQIQVQGQLPWNTVWFPFGIKENPETYLQAQEHTSLRLILTQGNAGAEVDVVLSQLKG